MTRFHHLVTLFFVVFGYLLLGTSSAFAHKVQIFAYVEKNEVFTESYFADGSPVKGGTIEVYTKEGSKVLEGKTDDKGTFSFALPKDPVGLKIVLDAGMGHRAEYILKKEDIQK